MFSVIYGASGGVKHCEYRYMNFITIIITTPIIIIDVHLKTSCSHLEMLNILVLMDEAEQRTHQRLVLLDTQCSLFSRPAHRSVFPTYGQTHSFTGEARGMDKSHLWKYCY